MNLPDRSIIVLTSYLVDLSFAMLRVGHLNAYHLYNKVPYVCNFLQSQSSSEYHLFGITDSRLDFRITDHSISIPDSHIIRRDWQLPWQTGIAVSVHQSVQAITHRRKWQNWMYLARIEAACTWTTAVYVLFLQKPSGYFWVVRLLCSFVQMLDVYKAKNPADVLILGDFNIDMLKPHSYWDSTLALFGLAQLITSPTRTTPTSTSLTDHTYTNNPCEVVTTDVSDISISDHNPISCTRSIKLPKPDSKGHT